MTDPVSPVASGMRTLFPRPEQLGFIATLLKAEAGIADPAVVEAAQAAYAAHQSAYGAALVKGRKGIFYVNLGGIHPVEADWEGDERLLEIDGDYLPESGDLRPKGARTAIYAETVWLDDGGRLGASTLALPTDAKEAEAALLKFGADPKSDDVLNFRRGLVPDANFKNESTGDLVGRAWQDVAEILLKRNVDKDVVSRLQPAFIEAATAFSGAQRKLAVDRFGAALDPEACRVLALVGDPSPNAYNWLCGDGKPARGAWRRQAAEQYPMFFDQLRQGKATRAIDAGRPFAGPVARQLALSAHAPEDSSAYEDDEMMRETEAKAGADEPKIAPMLKRLKGRSFKDFGFLLSRDLAKGLVHLSDVPPEWTPKGREEWAALGHVMPGLSVTSELLGRPLSQLVRESGRDWVAASRREKDSPILNAFDAAARFERSVILPVLADRASALGFSELSGEEVNAILVVRRGGGSRLDEAVRQAMFGNRGVPALQEMSKRWHIALPRLDADLSVPDPRGEDITWASAAPPFTTAAGWTVKALVSESALRQEGKEMRHCVGGYVGACLGKSHIFSLSPPGGNPRERSTLEVKDTGKPKAPFEVRQHFGYRDGDPSDEAKAALKEWLAHVASPERRASPEAIEKGRAEGRAIRTRQGGIRALVGYDPADKAMHAKAWEAYREFLPGASRHAAFDAWFETSGLSAKLDQSLALAVVSRERDPALWTKLHRGQAVYPREADEARRAAPLPREADASRGVIVRLATGLGRLARSFAHGDQGRAA